MLLTPEVTSIFQALSNDFYLIISLLLFFLCRPGQRTVDDLEIIYEELLHIKALSHLSTTVSCLLAEAEGRGAQFVLNALLGLKESIGECGRGAGTPEFSLTNGPSCFSRDAKEATPMRNHQKRIKCHYVISSCPKHQGRMMWAELEHTLQTSWVLEPAYLDKRARP